MKSLKSILNDNKLNISYDYNLLYQYIPEHLKDNSYVFDYGGYDNRLIVIEF